MQPTGDKRRGLVGRYGNVPKVRDDTSAVSADIVVGKADVDGLRAVARVDRRNLVVRQMLCVAALRISEQGNSGNVIGDLRGQLVAGQIGHTCALRIPSDHHLGVRAAGNCALHMGDSSAAPALELLA